MTVDYEVITCPTCSANYVNQTACPRCERTALPVVQESIQSRKKAPKPKSSKPLAIKDTPLSYTDYKALAKPNKVSVQEYNRYLYLHSLQERGIIQNLEMQIKYEVLPRTEIKPKISWYKGFTQSRVTYSPDFRYRWNGNQIVEEYKGLDLGTKKKPAFKPRMTTASRKSMKELMVTNPDFATGKAVFVITCWHRKHECYYAFNTNNKQFDYELANYIGLKETA